MLIRGLNYRPSATRKACSLLRRTPCEGSTDSRSPDSAASTRRVLMCTSRPFGRDETHRHGCWPLSCNRKDQPPDHESRVGAATTDSRCPGGAMGSRRIDHHQNRRDTEWIAQQLAHDSPDSPVAIGQRDQLLWSRRRAPRSTPPDTAIVAADKPAPVRRKCFSTGDEITRTDHTDTAAATPRRPSATPEPSEQGHRSEPLALPGGPSRTSRREGRYRISKYAQCVHLRHVAGEPSAARVTR